MQIRHNPLSGGYCGEVPPLPIPNREVKLTCADGTAMQCGRVGSRLLSISEASITKVVGAFLFSRGLILSHADVFWVTQISQMTQIFLWCFFFFPQISQMHTDFRPVRSGISQMTQLFYLFTFLPLNPFYLFTFLPLYLSWISQIFIIFAAWIGKESKRSLLV